MKWYDEPDPHFTNYFKLCGFIKMSISDRKENQPKIGTKQLELRVPVVEKINRFLIREIFAITILNTLNKSVSALARMRKNADVTRMQINHNTLVSLITLACVSLL